MGFPSELPAMRRLTLPAPHPVAAAFAWAGLTYAVANAVLHVPLEVFLPLDALSRSLGSPGAGTLSLIVASLAPALIIALLARRTPLSLPAVTITATYLAMLVLVVVFQLTGMGPDASSYGVLDCCRPRGPG